MENSKKSDAIKTGEARARAAGKHMGRPRRVFDRHEVVRLQAKNTSPAASRPAHTCRCRHGGPGLPRPQGCGPRLSKVETSRRQCETAPVLGGGMVICRPISE